MSDVSPARGHFSKRFVLGALAVALALGCTGPSVDGMPGAAGDLLAGRAPIRTRSVSHAERMTDAIIANDGDFWRTNLTSIIVGSGYAVWDLGSSQNVSCAAVQGDNNDFYELAGSEDGQTFSPLWTGQPMPKAGMQLRLDQHVTGHARYVKLSAHGGDGSYSVGELAIFARCPTDWPPRFVAREGAAEDEGAQATLVLLGIAAVLFLLLNRKGARDWVRLLAVVPLGIAVKSTLELWDLWPFEENVQTYSRAVVAAIAATLMLREYFWPKRYPAEGAGLFGSLLSLGGRVRARVSGTAVLLVVLSVVGASSYYHYGMPQFRDESKGRTTLVHPWDMRVYFPVAKYFRELRFDGLYFASVAAYLDNHPGMTPDAVADVHLRDLRNNEMTLASQVPDEIQGVRKRFTPARWEAFKKDMKYFEDVMGPGGYLGSLQDHGGNATPVWILGAYALWHSADASEATLSATALIDPVLLILMFVVIARTFGARVMLVTLIAWGTTDFSRFGTNLMGSTLRADWMVALGLGACALKKGRPGLGGALLAYAGLIRAFPAFATFFLALPPLWWVIDHYREKKALPSLAAFRAAQGPALRAIGGAALTVVVLVGVTSAMFGFSESWGTWTKKIVMHAEQPNSNHVGIRNLVSYSAELEGNKVADGRRVEPWSRWQELQRETLARRKPLFYVAVLAYLGLAVVACRRRRLDQAAIIGLTMIPVFFYPANYYCHYVFLIPLLATRAGEPRPLSRPEGRTLFAWVSGIILAMGLFQVPTLDRWGGLSDVSATWQSVILLAAYALILGVLARNAWKGVTAEEEDGGPVGDGEEEEDDAEEDEEAEEDEDDEDDEEDEEKAAGPRGDPAPAVSG